jgi:hypothetical protein
LKCNMPWMHDEIFNSWKIWVVTGRICQNRTADRDRFFWGPFVAQIEKCKTNESHKKSQIKKIFWELSRIFMVQHWNLFQDSNFSKSYLPQIRGSSWHNNKIKMIRRGNYSSNNFQDSNKRKSTVKKILGYLQRVLFFNAFELGAESGNQVIWSDEASSS